MLGNSKTMRLFVTGGTGFFGKSMLNYRIRHPEWSWAKADWVILSRFPGKFSALHPTLVNQQGVTFIEGDVRDFAFPAGHFDAIVHAATGVSAPLSDAEMESVIVDGVRHVLDFAKAVGGKKILFTSSGAVYGSRISPPSEEDVCTPVTAYGKWKLASEQMLVDSGLDVKIARCFAFVGPYLNRRIHYAIGNFIQDCLDGDPIVIKGDGTPLRSYLYADDLVEWLFAVLERGETGRPYNVGSDEGLPIRTLAEKVRAVLGTRNEIQVLAQPSVGKPSVYVPDVSRLKRELGMNVKVRLDDAIRMAVQGRL